MTFRSEAVCQSSWSSKDFFNPSYVSKKDSFDVVFKQNGQRLRMQANHHFAKAYLQCEVLNKGSSFCSRSFRMRKPHN